jgi:vitamin B12 transporter
MKRHLKTNAAIAAFAALTCATNATAQDDGEDVIIVEGLRLPTPAAETGSSVSVITAEDIELRGLAFAVDAIAIAPGVTVNQNGAFGGAATVRIRGAGSDQTLVLLDGAPIGDPAAVGGGFDFSVLDVADIERIEILKGPQSTLWGSDAIGGVVNIITKRPEEGFGARGFFEGGSFATIRGAASVHGGGEAGDFRVTVSGIRSDGISKADKRDGNTEKDGYDGLTISGRGGVNLPHDLRLEGSLRRQTADTEIDGFPPPDFTLADSDDRSESEQFTGSGTLIAPLFDGRFESRFMAGYTNIERRNFSAFDSVNKGDRLTLRYQGAAQLHERHRIAFGAEREKNQADGEETSIKGFFGLYEIKPVDSLTLTAGVRHDDHSAFGGETTARAAGAFSPTDGVTLRGSWGEAFKAPTIFQLTSTFGPLPPNSDLQPETSSAFDIGVDIEIPFLDAQFSTTYFDRDTENLIVFAPNLRYENIAAATAQGVETQLDIALTGAVSFSANHAYIDAEDRTTGERLIRVPRHTADVALIYESERFSGSATLRYNGAETEGPFGSDVESWVRVDLAASYAVSDAVGVYGRIENLFDANYQQISGYGTPGLSAYAGVRLTL